MNDPCAPIFFRGQYHLFHQYNPDASVWGDMHWAPATLRFQPTATGQLDYGHSFYAPKTQLDQHGNRILWGWLNETRPEAEFAAAGWAGMISLPRVLSIRNGRLAMTTLPGLRWLRGQRAHTLATSSPVRTCS